MLLGTGVTVTTQAYALTVFLDLIIFSTGVASNGIRLIVVFVETSKAA